MFLLEIETTDEVSNLTSEGSLCFQNFISGFILGTVSVQVFFFHTTRLGHVGCLRQTVQRYNIFTTDICT
jgi:hypothetical protein